MTIRSPGDIITTDILSHMNVRSSDLAVAMGMSGASISRILSGKAAITPETAIRFEAVLNEKAEYWLGLQSAYDLANARRTVDASSLTQLEAKPGLHSARAMLQAMFERYVGTDRRIPLVELVEISELCGFEALPMLMRQVDPGRKLFDYPVLATDLGLHGLALLENNFNVCSNIFGHEIYDEADRLSSEFISLAYDAYEQITFEVPAMVVWNKALDVPGFLVVKRLGKLCVPIEADMEALQAQVKAPIACYAELPGSLYGEDVILTAFIGDTARFDELADMSSEIFELAQKWLSKEGCVVSNVQFHNHS
jgi:addiction module HigA family antidote